MNRIRPRPTPSRRSRQAPADEAGKAIEAPPVGTCDASQVQSLVGQAYTDGLGKQAQEDAGASQVRVLKPNDVATMGSSATA